MPSSGPAILVNTGCMTNEPPWFERWWKRTESGKRAWVGVAGYLLAGILAVALAVVRDSGAAVRIGWALIGVVFLSLGVTLLATLVHRRNDERSNS